jgi:thioesterase domain-containing protein/acyl-CoA synthetase (AMP-forming)/AMP-acid ligase II/acyl carrier protein
MSHLMNRSHLDPDEAILSSSRFLARTGFWELVVTATLVAMSTALAWLRPRRRARQTTAPADHSEPAGARLGEPNSVPPERPIAYRSVSAHFEATAHARPDQVALRTASETLTYRDLLAGMHRWATVGRRDSRAPAALVSASLDSGTVSLILGMFAARTTVVTLDPATPSNRADTISAILEKHGYDVARVDPRTDSAPGAAGVGNVPGLDDVTSIQFTSGSTGVPKAVLHTNGLWLADAQLLNDRFGLADGCKVALCMPISFAGGLNVLIGSLLGGAEVIGIDPREHTPREAFAHINSSGAQSITCTPAFVDVLHTAAQGAVLPQVTRIVATGEAMHARHVRLARELAPNAVITNWVGSTETLAIASHDIPPHAPLPHGIVPVGIPAPHKKIEIGDDGAVSITSRYFGVGYLDPAATTASFTEHPDGTTTYAGGDVGRWDPHGNLVLSGRADSTVKIRGYLVEPAEIEVTLLSYADIREAVVTSDRSGPPTLTAYVAPSTTTRTPAVAELRTRLHRDLPPWMVPTHIVVLPALPRGDRGKIDRMALPRPCRPAFDPPRGPQEALVSRVWAEVLHVESIGRADSFYAMGGDSMSVAQMLVALRESHGIALHPNDLASAPTVSEFADKIAKGGGTAGVTHSLPGGQELSLTTVPLRAVSPTTVGTPLFCFSGAGASALCFAPLAQRVGGETAVYAFEPKGLQKRAVPDLSVRGAARRHLTDLRHIQPTGPYTLIGHSLGAHIALEVARMLEEDGAEVEMLIMLDPWLSPKVAKEARNELPDVTVTLEHREAAGGMDLWWERQRQVPLAGLFFGGYERRTMAIEEVGMMTGYAHHPLPWAGRAQVVLSHLNRDDPRLWPRILTGDVDVRVVDCDHHSIVREPHVGTVVDMILRNEVDYSLPGSATG